MNGWEKTGSRIVSIRVPPRGPDRGRINAELARRKGVSFKGRGSWLRADCRAEGHSHGKGHSKNTCVFHPATGMLGCQSMQCGGDESIRSHPRSAAAYLHGLDMNVPSHRQQAEALVAAAMESLGMDVVRSPGGWGDDADLTPEELESMLARADIRADVKRQTEDTLLAEQRRLVAERRQRIIAAGLPKPPLGVRGVDAPPAEIAVFLRERGERVHARDPVTKLPAEVNYGGYVGRMKYGTMFTTDPAVPARWAAGLRCRDGTIKKYPANTNCLESELAVVDVDYPNWSCNPRNKPEVAEFYAAYSAEELGEIDAWQHAIVALLLEMSGGNYAHSMNGGLHIFFKDPGSKYTATPLANIEGSVFELKQGRRHMGWIEVKAGRQYVATMSRKGAGDYQPLPDLVAEAAKLRQA